MISSLLAILFILNIRFRRNESVKNYILRRYNSNVLKAYRNIESCSKKLKKAQLDLDFICYCELNSVVPNFVKFKLYRKSLYSSEFYRSSIRDLLRLESKFKEKSIKRISSVLERHRSFFSSSVSSIDLIYFTTLIDRSLRSYVNSIKGVHEQKLKKLGISLPSFVSPESVIFNYSDYVLTHREKFLLSFGLDFNLPFFKPNFSQYFLPFEKLFKSLFYEPCRGSGHYFKQLLHSVAYKSYFERHTPNYPFFKRSDLNILRALSRNDNLIISRPDKCKGVVLLNRPQYLDKMNLILSDNTKFEQIDIPKFKLIFKIEDKVNRVLRSLRDRSFINDELYTNLHSRGSSLCSLYGLPKTHKPNVPLRPILAAYNSANYKLAKYLVPLLSHLTCNSYTLENSYNFVNIIKEQTAKSFMVSYDVTSLFTNIPVQETIEIILNKLFPTAESNYKEFSRSTFKTLLELAVNDSYFTFNNITYKQIDGMAMGSPLGPTFANIFMCHLEEHFLSNCPSNMKPIFYKRYIDDTFVLFKDKSHSKIFLDFINSRHPNISFTMDQEVNNQLSFLDVLVTKTNSSFITSVYRKENFSGLGMSFYSYCIKKFKINSCNTLIHRAFKICSTWIDFDEEMSFLGNFLKNNCYPINIFHSCINDFLSNIFDPKKQIPSVPKKRMYISFPFLGPSTERLRKELIKLLSVFYPHLDFKPSFVNPFRIKNFFPIKDSLPVLMRSGVVYKFNCPKCNLGTYIGSTDRLLKVRIDSHRGVSYRTGVELGTKEDSTIREHAKKCKHIINYQDFTVISQSNNYQDLLILESILIKEQSPPLNKDSRSTPIYIA